MRDVNNVRFQFVQILEKKVPKNPKYEHVAATVDTGTRQEQIVFLRFCSMNRRML